MIQIEYVAEIIRNTKIIPAVEVTYYTGWIKVNGRRRLLKRQCQTQAEWVEYAKRVLARLEAVNDAPND